MSQTLTPDVQTAFLNTLKQLLQDQTQQNALLLDSDSFDHLLKNKKIYNAYHDLAEQIYELMGFQLEQSLAFQYSLLQRILEQGRLPIYASISAGLHSTEPNQQRFDQIQMTLISSTEADGLESEDQLDFLDELYSSPIEAATEPSFINDGFTAGPLSTTSLVLMSSTANIDSNNTDHNQNNPSGKQNHEVKMVKKMPHFQIPNARVGQDYQARIQMQYPVKEDVLICSESIKIPEYLGIVFDDQAQQLQGIPLQAGEFKLAFQYKNNEATQAWSSGEVTFIITADPRSLWQVNEPDINAPYQKAHSDHQLIETEYFNLAACSQRGRSHEHAGTFRDDDFLIARVAETDWSILIVADGAGSASYSRQGSLLAVQSAAKTLTDYLEQHHPNLDRLLQQWQVGSDDEMTKSVAQQIYKDFHDTFYKTAQVAIESIEQEAELKQVAAKAYATTLLVAVVKQCEQKTFISTFWVGDGAIAVYAKDKVRLMGKPDGGEFAGQTRFLDRSFAQQFASRVNIGYYDDCEAVILMTDGISDPRFETDAGLANHEKWQALWQELEPQLQQPRPDQALLEWSKFFSAGHHDDRTLAILWNKPVSVDVEGLAHD
ncbi:serine/threonine protein phosphatase PrpC [Acinetobacter baylyi]|uniref:Serine/threonine protein phosphatase PrpC n=1 Tax=Acinetobacter baylyi TaxID=202950 RepID=A0ABU0US60_ACIBI|nr:PP2C family serine/threonine-protein phosphatase [Acinetobacter baylyi]MDQ1207366.1 serine/threonine protein phosphatase PrpC [Acinetobacter baylyi]MDR6105552.1 serine/threonine protein phosphatase PrpC [Acinetobacter baylyi]MDR6184237.1 serine/threonine protein phosphatase PrpC [Acinetobacter baylyi]